MQRTCVLLLFAAACATAPLPRTLSLQQTATLAQEVLRHTPEYTHWVEGTRFQWVVFKPGTHVDFPEAIVAIRQALARKYALYNSTDQLPDSAQYYDGDREAFVGGFLFSVSIRRIDASTIELQYSDYEGPLAAGERTVRYQWRGRRWVKVWQSPQIVS